jgi:signal transduction histidine kinase
MSALWRVDNRAGVLRCEQLWHQPSLEATQFEAATRASTFACGIGLPGKVWASRAAACIADVADDPGFLRATIAAREGFHSAFAFPILLDGEVIGVIDFVNREIRVPDPELIHAMATIGSQIGQFIERKRAENALLVAQAEIAHISRVMTMGELTASIAHEINQPLTGVVSSGNACLRYLASNVSDIEAARRAVERIIRDAMRANEVIKRIRALATKSPAKRVRLDINEVVIETVSLVRPEFQRQNISLHTELAEGLAPVLGDQIELQQVLLNLIMNAKEAMSAVDDHLLEVTITTEQITPNEVLVSVRDTGPGIDEAGLDRIFEAFYTTKSTGMGMGLPISRSIIEAHGGRLWAKPNQPRGAVFQFTVPVWQEEKQ